MFQRIKRLLGLNKEYTIPQTHRASGSQPVDGENILVISDLHLGEACKDHSRIEYLKRSEALDRHIVSFLEHYSEHRLNDRPWCLVMGGDLLDFLQVTMVPDEATEDELRYGLSTREEDSVWKFDQLVERHRPVFLHLAAFIGQGHRVEIIQGNHDEELFWPAVQNRFRDALLDLFFGNERAAPEARSEFAQRIHFNRWFYFVPGLFYMEHGHRFDEYCATPPQLCPVQPQNESELTQPVSALAIRYFANRQPGFQTHDKEHWGILDYYRYFRREGNSTARQLIGAYLDFAAQSVRYTLEHGRFVSEAAEAEHARGRKLLAREYELADSVIRDLDALSAPSAMASLLQVSATVCLFELAAGGAVLTSVLLTLLMDWSWLTDLACIGGVGASSFGFALWNRRRYDRQIRPKLVRAAHQIATLLKVPVVCFGHSHGATLQRHPDDHRTFYGNSGSFLNHPDHASHAADAPCDCMQTYLVVEAPVAYQYPRPKLFRWCHVHSVGHQISSAEAPNQR